VAELRAAYQAWGLWADGVRERAEQRLGVTDLADRRVLTDPEYGQALDAGCALAEALRAAEAVLQARSGCLAGSAQVGSPHP
jgi:hypothetical protein